MRTLPARRAPLWFVVLAAAIAAALVASWPPASGASPGAGDPSAPPALAFWGIFLIIVEALWKGVEVAGKVALAILQYSVQLLWRGVVLLAKAARDLGQFAWKGLRQAWGLLRATYDHVLKPAWKFVWKWVDKTERWLQRTFGPLVKFLRRVRKWVLDFYQDYIRPILDIIDIGRRTLRILASFGLEWARRLDRTLGEIQDAIDRPFRALLAKINEVINLVNRVVTADGLFQKLAHVRSIERDIREVSRAFANWRSHPLTDADYQRIRERAKERSVEQVKRDVHDVLVNDSGRYANTATEMVSQWETYLGVTR